MNALSFYKRLLADYTRDQRFLLLGGLKTWNTGGTELIAKNLLNADEQKVLMVASQTDLQAVEPDFPDKFYVGVPVPQSNERDYFGQLATYFSAIHDHTRTIEKDLENFDPARTARIIAPAWLKDSKILGRKVMGYRRQQWTDFEFDRIGFDHVFDTAIVPRAETVVTLPDQFDLASCLQTLDRGNGIVLIADGVSTGGGGLLFVKASDSPAFVKDWLDKKSIGQLKIVPKLSGPAFCTHGFVLKEGCPASRAFESLSLEKQVKGEIQWVGASTAINLSTDLQTQVHEYTEKIGNYLRQNLNYRGAFCLDGILTPEGPVFTEINTRMGASAYMASKVWRQAPGFLQLLDAFIREYPDDDFCCVQLQRLIDDVLGAERFSLLKTFSKTKYSKKKVFHFHFSDGDLQQVPPEHNGFEVVVEPIQQGSFVQCHLRSENLPNINSHASFIHTLLSRVCRHLEMDFTEYGRYAVNTDTVRESNEGTIC